MILSWLTDDIPVAQIPDSKNSKRSQPCIRCGRKLVVSRWDDWNSFLTTCPHCRGVHGKPRSIRPIIFGSILFHALSFFLTMRPLKALVLFVVVGGLFAGSFFLDSLRLPYAVEIVLVVAVLFAPMAINLAVLLQHWRILRKRQSREAKMTEAVETAVDLFS
jgi:hypothetical protein